jgi:hypothetical protein
MLPQTPVGQGLVVDASRSHLVTWHSVGLTWTSDGPAAETSTCQHTTFTRKKHSCPPGGIRNRNPKTRAVADPHLRPLSPQVSAYKCILQLVNWLNLGRHYSLTKVLPRHDKSVNYNYVCRCWSCFVRLGMASSQPITYVITQTGLQFITPSVIKMRASYLTGIWLCTQYQAEFSTWKHIWHFMGCWIYTVQLSLPTQEPDYICNKQAVTNIDASKVPHIIPHQKRVSEITLLLWDMTSLRGKH